MEYRNFFENLKFINIVKFFCEDRLLIDIIYKTVRPSHLEKLKTIQNVNKLMFQVIFIFSDWILIEQIIATSTPSVFGRKRFTKNSAWSFKWETGAWVKMYRFNAFSGNVNTINWKIFSHMLEYTSQRKFSKHYGETKP